MITMKNEVMKVNENWPEPWDKSRAMDHAKSLLLHDSDGTYKAMDLQTFQKLSPLFEQYPLEYLERYLENFRKKMAKNKEIVDFDEACLRHDRLIIPLKMTTKSGAARWDQHVAKKLLKEDITGKKHKEMNPKELRESRNEYQAFTPKVFRKHIHQEVYGQCSTAYWQYKTQKKEEEKKNIRSGLKRFL